MIAQAKILSSAGGKFNAVQYNDRKREGEKGELLKVKNFGMLEMLGQEARREDYVKYLQKVAFQNDRIKNKQFHAVLSVKGDSLSHEQLAKMAEDYMKEMGYGSLPYLVFGHYDTANNHVHIVSTRVDMEGKKVNDSFERLKSQQAMQKIQNISPEQEFKAIHEDISKYSFSTVAQYKALGEAAGYIMRLKGEKMEFIKYGKVQGTEDKAMLEERMKAYQKDQKRIKQLRAIFHKYKPAMEHEAFQKYLQEKFGVELSFHVGEGKKKAYGYTIIDHASKSIYKGGEVMPLEAYRKMESMERKAALAKEIIKQFEYKSEDKQFAYFQKALNEKGFWSKHDGTVLLSGTHEAVAQMRPWDLEMLKANTKLAEASSYNAYSLEGAVMLSELYQVPLKHISIQDMDVEQTNFINLIRSGMQTTSLGELQKALDFEIIQHKGEHYFIDRQFGIVVDRKDLADEKNDLLFEIASDAKVYDLYSRKQSSILDQALEQGQGLSLNVMAEIASALNASGETDRRKRKNKNQIQY
ncbi:relaxase/mobilization nuclease domain-containing protein [Persicobacter diffluens]|uniref:Mobilization protein n=1 Tax=Persicobacter diffluens TaxID=981 RepID=A0AAN4W3V2_9BACT|nr:mobilization protein [Persicobacter diffluens]